MLYKVMEKSQFDRNLISDNLYGKYHSYYWDEEEKLLDLVNDARRKAGVSELKYDADLNALCEMKMLENPSMDWIPLPSRYSMTVKP